MYLFRLVYYSRNTVATTNKSAFKEIKSILDAAARNNTRDGITGALLFNNIFFAQVLEGDRKAVTETFCRIAQDPRHSDMVIMSALPVNERMFDQWSMAFAGRSDTADRLYTRFGLSPEFNPAKMTSDSLVGFVQEMAKCEEHVAHAGEKAKATAA